MPMLPFVHGFYKEYPDAVGKADTFILFTKLKKSGNVLNKG